MPRRLFIKHKLNKWMREKLASKDLSPTEVLFQYLIVTLLPYYPPEHLFVPFISALEVQDCSRSTVGVSSELFAKRKNS